MRTANSVTTPDGGSGMEHLREYRAAADGKLHVDNSENKSLSVVTRRLIFAAAAVLATTSWSGSGHAQAGGPFAGMAGVWSGGGPATPGGGGNASTRCRGTYPVG